MICFDKIWLALEPIAGISIQTIFSIKNGNGICPGDTLVLGSLLNIPLNIFFGIFCFYKVMNVIQHDAQGVQFEWVFFFCFFDDM